MVTIISPSLHPLKYYLPIISMLTQSPGLSVVFFEFLTKLNFQLSQSRLKARREFSGIFFTKWQTVTTI